MRPGLVIIHVDGLSYARLRIAVDKGHMPFVARLMETEGYEALAYRCGVPSTTPFAQAGILFGDNSEIPSYRWWDKRANLLVSFGSGSTFGRVAPNYFSGRKPLTQGGACIAALYRARARRTGSARPTRSAIGPTNLRPAGAPSQHSCSTLWLSTSGSAMEGSLSSGLRPNICKRVFQGVAQQRSM